jgi:hypothetical protein
MTETVDLVQSARRGAGCRHGLTRWHRIGPAILTVLLVGCGRASVSAPPVAAGPRAVLEAYLAALVDGDCSARDVLGIASFGPSNGDLCGEARVRSYGIVGNPATPTDAEAIFPTRLTTDGSADGSVRPGTITWFFDLRRQSDGAWRLAGGGSGP